MSQSGKLKVEEKISLIRKYQEGKISFNEAVAQAATAVHAKRRIHSILPKIC